MMWQLLLNKNVLGAAAIGLAVLATYVQTQRLATAKAELKTITTAQAMRAAQELKNKERADEEYDRRRAADERLIAGLRKRALQPAGPAPSNSKCPDGQVCYDRADFERAYGELAGEVREEAARCTALETELEIAEEWAR